MCLSFSFSSKNICDILFFFSEPDWWRVRHLRTGDEGLIPWNFVAEEKSVESEE